MRTTKKMIALCTAATGALALLAGCSHNGSPTSTTATTQLVGPNGKVYSGTQNQITQKVGEDYGQSLKAMAEQRASARQ
jgi:hypothetical protein